MARISDSGPLVRLAEPATQLIVELRLGADPDPVRAHAAGGLEPAARLAASKVQADLEPATARRPHRPELLRAAQAHVCLLRRKLDVGTDTLGNRDDGLVQRPQRRLR